ncbi:MAG: Gldg family protein [Proteobacteria bacterium]|nr:Gldg family protein [Pseudomonadota bacterium]
MKHSVKNKIISGTGLILATCLFVATIILVNTALTTWRIDLTEKKLFTLSEGTINILRNLEEPVQLDFYLSQKAMHNFPLLANYGVRVRDMLQEYAAHANGQLILNIIEPETFSEAEDQAVASGLRTVSANASGDRVYFGMVGTNSTDDEKVIPFFQTNRESALEYDITKLIYNLAYPDKRVVGIYSQLPVMGKEGDKTAPTWTIIHALKEFFDVRDLNENIDELDQKIDVLMLVHPKKLNLQALYAIDQYLLRGGKAIIFVDPLAEQDKTQPDPAHPNVMPKLDSYLSDLLELWGLEISKDKIVGDINAAMRVQANGPRGPKEIDYLPWLRLTEKNFNADDFSTSELNRVHMGTVGSIELKEDKGMNITPLIQTSKQSTKLERDLILFQRDPSVILNNFKSEDKQLLIAVRIKGQAKTAFPEGSPTEDIDNDFVSEGDINVILVSDTDILADHFWVRTRRMFGVAVPQPIANNGDFVINSIENLSGNTDMISLRGRGKYSRPFEKVNSIRREAEAQFRQREKELQASLEETENKIHQLQQEQGNEKSYLLNNKLTEEVDKFRDERLATRKELRGVQHELKKNIEKLGAQLRFINIGLIPLLITLLALMIGIYRANKRT